MNILNLTEPRHRTGFFVSGDKRSGSGALIRGGSDKPYLLNHSDLSDKQTMRSYLWILNLRVKGDAANLLI